MPRLNNRFIEWLDQIKDDLVMRRINGEEDESKILAEYNEGNDPSLWATQEDLINAVNDFVMEALEKRDHILGSIGAETIMKLSDHCPENVLAKASLVHPKGDEPVNIPLYMLADLGISLRTFERAMLMPEGEADGWSENDATGLRWSPVRQQVEINHCELGKPNVWLPFTIAASPSRGRLVGPYEDVIKIERAVAKYMREVEPTKKKFYRYLKEW